MEKTIDYRSLETILKLDDKLIQQLNTIENAFISQHSQPEFYCEREDWDVLRKDIKNAIEKFYNIP